MNRRHPSTLHRARRARGLTLVELVVSSVAITILVGGMTSAIMLASRALPEHAGTLEGLVNGGDVLEQIAGDLLCAASIAQDDEHAVEFWVADRSGDAVAESIRYAWSGISGDPLTRSYNGGDPQVLIGDVTLFSLDYQKVGYSVTGDPTESETGEMLVASYDSGAYLDEYPIRCDYSVAQVFTPSLPATTQSWRITRAAFQMRSDGCNDGRAAIQLRSCDAGGKPTSEVLAEQQLLESTLTSNWEWRIFSFTNPPDVYPTDSVCIVVLHVANGTSCRIRRQNGGVTAPNTWTVYRSRDTGASWEARTDEAVLFYIGATATTVDPPEVTNYSQIFAVHLSLLSGKDPAAQTETTVQLLNLPEVQE